MTAHALVATLALVGLVILTAALLSGIGERRGWPQVWVFLALGAALGAPGAGLVSFDLNSAALQVVATLGLTLVLFTDAIRLSLDDVRRVGRIGWTVLGPGTVVPAVLTALAAWWLLDLRVADAVVVGAALASTDPVMVRGLAHRQSVPGDARLALRLESGLNDVVVLPPIVIAIQFMSAGQSTNMAASVAGSFLLGPLAGVAIGWIAIRVLAAVRSRFSVRRDYESIYAIGVAFTAFAAAEALHGSGYLAAFAAGLTIAALDIELCDCFVDFGQASAEMFMLLTFVAFGAGPIWHGLEALDWRVALFGVFAILSRTVVLLIALRGTTMDVTSRRVVAWFGPRGLSTLLLALLPVFAGAPGSARVFAICAAVVLMSLLLHGSALAYYVGRLPAESAPPATTTDPARAASEPGSGDRITLDELDARQAAGEEIVVADVRTQRSFDSDRVMAAGAVRLPPDDAVQSAIRLNLPRGAIIAAYCT